LYEVPKNVACLQEVHCRGGALVRHRAARGFRRARSRVLAAIRRIHTDDRVDDDLLDDLAAGDLTVHELLHGGEAFELMRDELYPQVSPGASFTAFFWHFRAMHVPMLRLLAAPCPTASVYHAVSTGYAGLIGAVASWRHRRPLVVTEHGLYARERELELSRAAWLHDNAVAGPLVAARPSLLRRFWSRWFRMLSRIAYHRAARLLTLSEVNRVKQLADGADPAKLVIVPNGIDQERWRAVAEKRAAAESRRTRIGFVGRVVPIKDVVTLIRAVGLAREQVDLELWIVGPADEDPAYAQRCHALVDQLGLGEHVKFLGSQPVADIYPQLDGIVLTSLSEGQPLVILEAHAAGLPVVASDVGACRELIEGGDETDRRLGPSGIVTRVACPADTAAALVRLARNPELRATMGRAGLQRVSARYQLSQVVATYDSLYASMVSP
jgi:glycosyltransferase involved in cell wall biosynthesis